MATEKITYDEFCEKVQLTALGRQEIGKQLEENLQKKYVYRNNSCRNLSMDQFLALRRKQMQTVHERYVQIRNGYGSSHLMGPRSIDDTSLEAARRMTGPNGLYNNDALALDEDDLSMLSELAQVAPSVKDDSPRYQVLYTNVETIVNNTQALKDLAQRYSKIKISDRTFCRETDAMRREIFSAENLRDPMQYGRYMIEHSKSRFSKVLQSIKDMINGVKEQDKPLGKQTMFEVEK